MARDSFAALDRCYYCGRRGVHVWDVDLYSCSNEVCESLAFAEVRRRNRYSTELPEKRLARALLRSLTTFERELRLDVEAELMTRDEARRIDETEREATARVLTELHELERRHPARTRAFRPARGHRSRLALA